MMVFIVTRADGSIIGAFAHEPDAAGYAVVMAYDFKEPITVTSIPLEPIGSMGPKETVH